MSKTSSKKAKVDYVLGSGASGARTDVTKDILPKLASKTPPKVIYTGPWANSKFLDDIEKNNKTKGNKKIFWVFGENDVDKQKANSLGIRTGSANQASVLNGRTHKEYNEYAVGVVTTKYGAGPLSESFKQSLEDLYDTAAKNPDAVFIVPATFDKQGNLSQVNIGTGIAANSLAPESVKEMTDAIQTVLSNIAQGIREPVPDIVLKPKTTQIKETTPIKQQLPAKKIATKEEREKTELISPKPIPVPTQLDVPLERPVPMNVPLKTSIKGKKNTEQPVLLTSQSKSNAKSINKSVGAELWHKIKKNPWKAIGVVLLAAVWPIGTVAAGTIMAGVMVKSVYDSRVNKQSSKAELHSPVSSRQSIPHRKQRSQISPPPTPNMNKGHNKSKSGGEHMR
jgi:hypothetical protein